MMGESIAEVAAIAAKLTKLTKPDARWMWPNEADQLGYRIVDRHPSGLVYAVRNHLISQGADHDR